jgi:glycosyltransferase involved in cell wall biosynthesis
MVVIEAFARGTPVVASSIGALAEIIDEGRTGLHFLPGDPANLAAKVSWLGAHANELGRMRREARADYEAKYTGEHNYRMLLGVYNRAIEHSKAEGG